MTNNKLSLISDETFQVFENSEFGNLEVIMIDGNPYFPAYQVAKILGYLKPENAISRHCRYTLKRGIPHPQSSSKTIEVNFIPEADLYRLIAKSKLPAAEKFERWVFEDVLPSIRKHGMYATYDQLQVMISDPKMAIATFQALDREMEARKAAEAQVSELAPKAEYHDNVLNKKGLICISTIAKDFGFRSAKALNNLLHEKRIIYRDGSGVWKPYAEYEWLIKDGYADYHSYDNPDATPLLKWTEKGRRWIDQQCDIWQV